MAAQVLVLPGIERRDLGEAAPASEVLLKAMEDGITDVIVVGRDRAGDLHISSSSGDADRVVGQLMRAVQFLASATIAQPPAEDEDEGGESA
jgi:hypothetical protein